MSDQVGTAVVPAVASNVIEMRPAPPPARTHLIQPTTFQEVIQMSEFLARSGLVGSNLRGKPADIAVILLKGSELGLPPMTSLAQIHVIDGKPGCSPELMRALALRAGHRVAFTNLSGDSVTIRGTRADGETLEVTWTMERAKAAKLTGKDNWTKYPQAMLAARATSELARYLFPDLGIGYIPEELGATVDERGEVIEVHSLNDAPPAPVLSDAAIEVFERIAAMDAASKAEFVEWKGDARVTAVSMTANPELLDSVRGWLDFHTSAADGVGASSNDRDLNDDDPVDVRPTDAGPTEDGYLGDPNPPAPTVRDLFGAEAVGPGGVRETPPATRWDEHGEEPF